MTVCEMNDDDIEWERAACRGMGPDLFFKLDGQMTLRDLDTVRQVCGGCPIRVECGEYGRAHEQEGIWGGRAADPQLNNRLHSRMVWVRTKRYVPCSVCGRRTGFGVPVRLDQTSQRYICQECST